MKKFFPAVAFLLLSTARFFAQDVQTAPSPTPTPTDEPDVVKISTNLVQVDVTVTDSKGRIVRDLRPDEIEIYQNGKKQDISNFSFISNTRENTTGNEQKIKPQPVFTLPPTPVRPENVKRTIALVVDDLTLSFESTYYVRRALKKFVDEQMQDGDLVAIIRTGAGIGALQQFTTDRRQLYAAIEKVRWNPAGSGKIGAFAPLEAKIPATEPTPEPGPGERTSEGIDRENNDFRASVFATGTLGAVNYIVRGMADLPGRKSIMLLSDGFKLFTKDAGGSLESGRVLDAIRVLVDKANRASVVIYTMDPRGLVVTGLTAADNTGGRTSEEIQTAESDRRDELFDTQDGLRYLAKETGGFAIINSNDLSGGIRRILDDQSFYLVGYQPDEATFDPKTRRFNKLIVKVTRKGANVRYRSGFFGITDEKLEKTQQSTAANRLANALTSPFAVNEISLRLNTLFGNSGKDGSYLRSLLHVRSQDLSFTDEPDGGKKTVFDVLAVAFGDNGQPVDHITKTYTVTLKKEIYTAFLKSGFVYNFVFPIKKPGAYQLRVAFRDNKSGKVGSANQFIEVPNLKKNRLTLSGVGLENVSLATWQKRNSGAGKGQATDDGSDSMADTAVRQFKRGTVLNYGLSIYNAKTESGQLPNLTSQLRIFRDGKPIFEGKTVPLTNAGQTDPKVFNYVASLSLGTEMATGDYVMQIIITDNLAKEKQKTATQFVQFEIVE